MKTAEQLREFPSRKAEEYSVEPKDINDIINERIHQDVAIQFKHDNGFRMDIRLKEIKKILGKGDKT